MFHPLLIQRLSFVVITLQVTLNFTCGIKFYYFSNHFTTIMQGLCKVVNTLHKAPQPCDNLLTTLQDCSKVATTYVVISVLVIMQQELTFNKEKNGFPNAREVDNFTIVLFISNTIVQLQVHYIGTISLQLKIYSKYIYTLVVVLLNFEKSCTTEFSSADFMDCWPASLS